MVDKNKGLPLCHVFYEIIEDFVSPSFLKNSSRKQFHSLGFLAMIRNELSFLIMNERGIKNDISGF